MSKSSDLFRKQETRRNKMPSPMGQSAQQEEPEGGENSAAVSTDPTSPKDSGPKSSPSGSGHPAPSSIVEHKILRRQTLVPEEELNLHGREGWELVTALPVPMRLGEESLFFFKRRKGTTP